MLKFKQGYITNMDGKTQEILVRAKSPVGIKDIVIGGVFVVMGIIHLTCAAFKNGSEAFEEAEVKTLRDLEIVDD